MLKSLQNRKPLYIILKRKKNLWTSTHYFIFYHNYLEIREKYMYVREHYQSTTYLSFIHSYHFKIQIISWFKKLKKNKRKKRLCSIQMCYIHYINIIHYDAYQMVKMKYMKKCTYEHNLCWWCEYAMVIIWNNVVSLHSRWDHWNQISYTNMRVICENVMQLCINIIQMFIWWQPGWDDMLSLWWRWWWWWHCVWRWTKQRIQWIITDAMRPTIAFG